MVDRVADFLLCGGKDAVWAKKKDEHVLAALQDDYVRLLNPGSRDLLIELLSEDDRV